MKKASIRAGLRGSVAVLALASAHVAWAQSTTFDIPSEDAGKSIPELARQAGIQIVAPGKELHGVLTPAMSGAYDVRVALVTMLRGTRLSIATDDGQTIVLAAAQSVAAQNTVAQNTAPVVTTAPQPPASSEVVIVTGTRVQGMTAADSAAPITVLGSDALTNNIGTTDVRDALGATVPAFTAQQFGISFNNLTLSAALRGLSPNDTLILVDGHRRHYSGLMHFSGGAFDSASSAPDLTFIPEGAIDHVEVLLEGAAAQYGTDAIAGVVNIILKKNSSGGQLSATVGRHYSAQGSSYDVSYNEGFPLFDKGFVDVTLDKQFSDYTRRGGPSTYYINAQGQPVPQSTVTGVGASGVATLSSTGDAVPNTLLPYVPGYPNANAIYGNPQSQLTSAELNAGYDFSDNLELYAFGTVGHRDVKSNQTYRTPQTVIATLGSDQPCSATNLNGYNTALAANGITAECAIGIGGGVTALGTNGLDGHGQVISSGSAGNLFSAHLVNSVTGALLPSATGEPALGTQPELVMYPGGFRPFELLTENDYQYNTGLQFKVAGWNVDTDVSYGKDIDLIYTQNSANESLFLDTHTTLTSFYDGSFFAGQLTGTIDAAHNFNVGMASPLTVAIGGEAREDTYGIGAGEQASYYGTGAQSRPGFLPAVAGSHSRKNYAGYVDFAVEPIEGLQVDVAGRVEHYTDFGDAEIGKINARYDFSPKWAIRGTISTGFAAPTLEQEYYTNTSVSPTSATVALPANSPAAKLLGFPNLIPEVSTSYTVGIVAHPLENLSATLDAYSIAVGNRITVSSTISAANGTINEPVLVPQALAVDGITLDPTVTQQGVTAFLNALSSISQGVDLTVNYLTDFDDYGQVNWTAAGNYNQTAISSIAQTPAILLAGNPNATFFSGPTQYAFTHGIPNEKIALTADWSLDQFGIMVRETYYGPQHGFTSPGNAEEIQSNQAGVGITDLSLRYNVTDQLQFVLGGNNIFNILPDVHGFAPSSCSIPTVTILAGGKCTPGPNAASGQALTDNNDVSAFTPLGTAWDPNGGYYYARVTFKF
jgi:iron complex outermembrane receptor protein